MKQENKCFLISIQSIIMLFILLYTCNSAFAAIEWSNGGSISTPSIIFPSDGQYFGLNSTMRLSCYPPSDSDHWYDTVTTGCGDEADTAVKATWSCSGGSFVGSNVGNAVMYTTPTTTGPVTITVTFDDTGTSKSDDTQKSTTITIYIVNAKIRFLASGVEASNITRGNSGTFEVVDDSGNVISGATYSDWAFAGEIMSINSDNTAQTWAGTMVHSGIAGCNVTVGGDTAEVSSEYINVGARSGWAVSINFASDIANTFFSFPISAGWGDCTNQYSGLFMPIIISHNIAYTKYEDTYNIDHITSGPNQYMYYISSANIQIYTQSRINQYLEPGDTDYLSVTPNAPNMSWYSAMTAMALTANAIAIRSGIVNHEGYGTGGTPHGHQRHLETTESSLNDMEMAIEDLVADNDTNLKQKAYDKINPIENAIHSAWVVEPTTPPWGNWAGGTALGWATNRWIAVTLPAW